MEFFIAKFYNRVLLLPNTDNLILNDSVATYLLP